MLKAVFVSYDVCTVQKQIKSGQVGYQKGKRKEIATLILAPLNLIDLND